MKEFFENSVRAEMIIHIPTMLIDSPPDVFTDAIDDDFDDVMDLLGATESLKAEIEGESRGWARDDLIAELAVSRDAPEWLVKFATPVPKNIKGDGYSFSWGHYTCKWFAGSSYEGLCRNALEWQERFISEMRLKAERQAKENP
jgi:hypothetical protein